MANVKIYTTTYCPYCKKAKALFEQLGVEFEEINVEEHPELRDEIVQKYNVQAVPVIVVGEKYLGSFDDIATMHIKGTLKSELGLE
ncbi:MAG: glutaredoxin domain-containing protein [Candidatus Magasanikbacteria bacterium]